MVPCSSVQTAFNGITGVPVMMAEMAGTTHGSWIGSIKDPVMVGTDEPILPAGLLGSYQSDFGVGHPNRRKHTME